MASRARRYTADEWEVQKPNIERLYIKEEKPLKEVICLLEQNFGFVATEKQFKTKLRAWTFNVKNVNGRTMVQLARARAKRELEDKDTSFRVHKKPVEDR